MTKNIVVTGANGDIGKAAVKLALERGLRVTATVRSEAKRALLPEHPNLQVVFSDVANYENLKTDFASIVELAPDNRLDAVIHCAAITHPCAVELLPLNTVENLLRVNTLGSLGALQAAMPYLRASEGHFVLAGSLWGKVSGPMVGAYAASKWALEALFDSARRETLDTGCSLVMVNIGAVKSAMVDNHASTLEVLVNSVEENSIYRGLYENHLGTTKQFENMATTPEKVARSLVDIAEMKKPAARYSVGIDAKALRLLNWLLPQSTMDRLLTA